MFRAVSSTTGRRVRPSRRGGDPSATGGTIPNWGVDFISGGGSLTPITGTGTPTVARALNTATAVNSSGLIAVVNANLPRFDYDPVTLAIKGLLIEESRTNLVLNSGTLITQSVTVTNVAHTLSFYGTGTVTLTGVSTAGPLVGTGAYPTRVTLTFTPTAGSLTLTVSGSVTFAQLEVGGFASSYIPTTAATVTRNADVVTLATASLSGFSAATGTMIADFSSPRGNSVSEVVWQLDDGTTANRHVLFRNGVVQAMLARTDAASVTQSDLAVGNIVDGARSKVAFAYAVNDFAGSLNAAAVVTDGAGALPTPSTLRIGDSTASRSFNGYIRSLEYYNTRLSNANLVLMSTQG